MSHVPHELADDFPDLATRIQTMKAEDSHFARLTDEYHDLNRDIHRAETNVEPTDDFHMEDMRRRRMVLKDTLYAMLKAD